MVKVFRSSNCNVFFRLFVFSRGQLLPRLLEKAPNLNEEREKSIIFLKRGEREEEARAGEVKMLSPLQFILKPVQK